MAVLERQRARLKYQQQQHFQEPQENYVIENKSIEFHLTPQFHGLINNNSMLREIANPPMNANQCLDNTFPEFGKSPIAGDEFFGERKGFATSSEIATSNCSLAAATTIGTESLKKRKAEFVEAENCEEQRIKENAEDVEFEVAEKNNLETSDTSKENSKASESQKPDYIHVRARRGQATDSHSLAERARREKIGKKMKCLQDLVPGCNKVAGKAGMLDEIINYVQSLQRQVEFLSMKLAALNPMLDVNIDEFLAKEFPAYVASFPTAAASSEMANLAYLQFNHVQQGATSCGLDMPINPPQTAIRGTTSSSLSIPEIFLDSSCFPQVQPFSTGETDLQSLYNVEFH